MYLEDLLHQCATLLVGISPLMIMPFFCSFLQTNDLNLIFSVTVSKEFIDGGQCKATAFTGGFQHSLVSVHTASQSPSSVLLT